MTVDNTTPKRTNPAVLTSIPNPDAGYPGSYLPAQMGPIGGLMPSAAFPQNANPPELFKPLTIRGVTFQNRMWVAPMCMCEYRLLCAEWWWWWCGVRPA